MKKFFVHALLISIFVLGMTAAVEAVFIDPSNPNIQYMGRWNFDNPGEPWIAWKSSTIKVRFNGTAITGDFDAGRSNEQFRVIVDGAPDPAPITISKTRNDYTLASGLSSGEHTVEIMKETFNNNNATFYGFEITGSILAPPPKPSMRIEYFGDSNMDGSSLYSEQNTGDHGSYYAFPAVASRMLNAEHNDQSVGGATLDGNGDNNVHAFIYSQNYYNQNNYTPIFDPHVIVINAGANDVGAGKTTIKNRYKTVISELRSAYGAGPHIVLFNSYGWDPNEPANYTREVVNEVGGNLSVCLFPWMWMQWHGSMIEHAGEARILADHILSLGLGFTQVQDAEIFDAFGRDFDVANGSFEESGIGDFGAFGWRYYDDPGVSRVYDPADAADGDYYLRLTATGGGDNYGSVHQGTDATGDFLPGPTSGVQDYYVTLMMRGSAGSQAEIIAQHQVQEVYDFTGTADVQTVYPTTDWQQYTVHLTAPAGIWQTFIRLRAAGGVVDFDAVSMSDTSSSGYCDDGVCDPGEDSCNCPSDCGAPPSTEAICDDGDDEDCDGDTDCDDADCTADPVCASQGTTDDFSATDDAQVRQKKATTNYGSSSDLRVRGATTTRAIESYVKFNVSGVGLVSSAILKVYSDNVNMTVDVYSAASTSWTEGGITWNNAPGSTGGSIDTIAVTTGWAEFDVTSAVTGDGVYAFVLKGGSTATGRDFSSSEGANPPVLSVTHE